MSSGHVSSVLVVGAGPVGLTLALDLAWRGIDVTVIEQRHEGEPPDPKCNHVAARSMEIFRRLGVAAKLRNAGLPEDYPHAIAYRTAFTGREFGRIHIPCRRDRFTDRTGADSDWPTPELPHRINQLMLEPILFDHVAATPGVKIFNRVALESFAQNDDHVTAIVRDLNTGEVRRHSTRYLIGCDGSRSTIRRALGIKLEGDAELLRVQATFIWAPQLIDLQRHERAWMTHSVHPKVNGNVIAIDGREHWMMFNYLRPDQTDFDAVDRDGAIRTILGVGPDFTYEVISKQDWIGRRLIAERFRERRVFLAGDAAHIWAPFGGYGMNAGIADATNLSWLLAAHLNGWAPATILDAYEAERWPITEQVSHFAMSQAEQETERRCAVPAAIQDEGPEGDRVRDEAGRIACEVNTPQYAAAGLNFGYFYESSPLIAYDGSAYPPYTIGSFTPSSMPDCRAPHLWLDDGQSLYDAFGPEYTLLRFDPSADVAPMIAAARRRGFPLTVLDVASKEAAIFYTTKLVLARPDQHVAWRGDNPPADSLGLVDQLRGALVRT
jgi:2-polyprenyl-6-methoxyphenol hydroxylase-like FAD-dependent oxidoreductase